MNQFVKNKKQKRLIAVKPIMFYDLLRNSNIKYDNYGSGLYNEYYEKIQIYLFRLEQKLLHLIDVRSIPCVYILYSSFKTHSAT